MFWLLLFGFLHAYFIWEGDILVAYAICGCLIYLLRSEKVRVNLNYFYYNIFIVPLNQMTYYSVEELKHFCYLNFISEEINTEVQIMQGSLNKCQLDLENAIEFQTLVFMI